MEGLVVIFFLMSIFGLITALMAGNRGRSAFGWFIFGFIFSFLPMILLVLMPNLEEEKRKAKENYELRVKADEEAHRRRLAEIELKQAAVQVHNTKECPFCAETIKEAAKVCRFCGKDIPSSGVLSSS